MTKNILKGNEAIEAYEELQSSYSVDNMPRKCGWFISDDCESSNKEYDNGTVVAFDSTSGDMYEMGFTTVNDALDWIEK